MKARRLAALLALAMSRPAAAEPHKLLVLQSEGRADAATRAKLDAAVVRLARTAEPETVAGELNFSDAATAVGCKPDTVLCKDEVMSMLGVDEIVATSVAPKPGGLEITVHRYAKGGSAREATMVLPTGASPDRLDGIAPLFGDQAAPAPSGSAAPAPASPGSPPASAASGTRPAAPGPAVATERPAAEPPVIPPPATVAREATPSPDATPEPASAPLVEPPDPRRHRFEVAGMAGGGAMVVLGALFWAAASSVQGDIDKAPVNTKRDLQDLKDLESRGDGYAAIGNVLVVTGVLVGGIATAFYIKDRRTASMATARLTPTVLDHGAGLVVTFGGTP